MRSAILNAESSSCVTTTTDMPNVSLSLIISSSSAAAITGSRPADGSSMKVRRGSRAMARATAARLSIPPDNSEGNKSSLPSSPTKSSFIRTIKSMVCSSKSVCSTMGKATFWATVSDDNKAPD